MVNFIRLPKKRTELGRKCDLNRRGINVAERIALWQFEVPELITIKGIQNLDPLAEKLLGSTVSPKNDIPTLNRKNKKAKKNARLDTREIEKEKGWEFIGGGTVRNVYRPNEDHIVGSMKDDCIAKIAKWNLHDHDEGQEQNWKEIMNWVLSDEEGKKLIADVFGWGEYRQLWVLEREAKTDDRRLTEEKANEIADKLEELGWAVLDLDKENIGIINNRVVAIDTGIAYAETGTERYKEIRREWQEQERNIDARHLKKRISNMTDIDLT